MPSIEGLKASEKSPRDNTAAFESLYFYGDQKLNVIDIKLNEQQTLAWLKINLDSPRFPDIHLDLLLKRTHHSQWRGVDFRFKGITYVNLKKNT